MEKAFHWHPSRPPQHPRRGVGQAVGRLPIVPLRSHATCRSKASIPTHSYSVLATLRHAYTNEPQCDLKRGAAIARLGPPQANMATQWRRTLLHITIMLVLAWIASTRATVGGSLSSRASGVTAEVRPGTPLRPLRAIYPDPYGSEAARNLTFAMMHTSGLLSRLQIEMLAIKQQQPSAREQRASAAAAFAAQDTWVAKMTAADWRAFSPVAACPPGSLLGWFNPAPEGATGQLRSADEATAALAAAAEAEAAAAPGRAGGTAIRSRGSGERSGGTGEANSGGWDVLRRARALDSSKLSCLPLNSLMLLQKLKAHSQLNQSTSSQQKSGVQQQDGAHPEGSTGGSFSTADANAAARRRGCVVYSLGSAGRYGFEDAVLRHWPYCRVVTYDCTLEGRSLDGGRRHTFVQKCVGGAPLAANFSNMVSWQQLVREVREGAGALRSTGLDSKASALTVQEGGGAAAGEGVAEAHAGRWLSRPYSALVRQQQAAADYGEAARAAGSRYGLGSDGFGVDGPVGKGQRRRRRPRPFTVLKMDIEGYEWGVFADWASARTPGLPDLLLVELHTFVDLRTYTYLLPYEGSGLTFEDVYDSVGFKAEGWQYYRRAYGREQLAALVMHLAGLGYALVGREDNPVFEYSCCAEFVFLRVAR